MQDQDKGDQRSPQEQFTDLLKSREPTTADDGFRLALGLYRKIGEMAKPAHAANLDFGTGSISFGPEQDKATMTGVDAIWHKIEQTEQFDASPGSLRLMEAVWASAGLLSGGYSSLGSRVARHHEAFRKVFTAPSVVEAIENGTLPSHEQRYRQQILEYIDKSNDDLRIDSSGFPKEMSRQYIDDSLRDPNTLPGYTAVLSRLAKENKADFREIAASTLGDVTLKLEKAVQTLPVPDVDSAIWTLENMLETAVSDPENIPPEVGEALAKAQRSLPTLSQDKVDGWSSPFDEMGKLLERFVRYIPDDAKQEHQNLLRAQMQELQATSLQTPEQLVEASRTTAALWGEHDFRSMPADELRAFVDEQEPFLETFFSSLEKVEMTDQQRVNILRELPSHYKNAIGDRPDVFFETALPHLQRIFRTKSVDFFILQRYKTEAKKRGDLDTYSKLVAPIVADIIARPVREEVDTEYARIVRRGIRQLFMAGDETEQQAVLDIAGALGKRLQDIRELLERRDPDEVGYGDKSNFEYTQEPLDYERVRELTIRILGISTEEAATTKVGQIAEIADAVTEQGFVEERGLLDILLYARKELLEFTRSEGWHENYLSLQGFPEEVQRRTILYAKSLRRR